MKNLSKIAIFVMATSLSGCIKDDLTTSGSLTATVSSNDVLPQLNSCKIRRIYQDDGTGQGITVTALFTYNKVGNPYSVVYSNEGTGVHNHYFFYDAQNRLTEYRQSYVTFPVVQHFYKYNAGNQIVKDSIVHINAGNGEINTIHVSTLEYDAMGRVVKETIVNTFRASALLEPTRRPTYTYDSRGNIAVAGWKSSSYDYKINPLRQNAIFQFIFRNYSMNNAAVQPKYNSLGLPLSMKPSNDFFFNALETSKVVYDCQ
jgi:hypothetical protein